LRRLLVGTLLFAATAGGAIESVPLRGLRAEVAALLMQGVSGGSLPTAAAVFRPAVDGMEAPGELSFLVELPTAPPVETEGQRPLEIYAYAVDETGEVAAHFAVILPDWPTEGEGVKIPGRLQVTRGDLSVRFLAWDVTARRYGMVVRRATADGIPGAPRIDEECSDWSVAGKEVADLSSLSAQPVLVSGETQRLSLGGTGQPDGWRVRLVRDRGGEVTTQEVPASAVAAGELEFVVPDLPPGIYQLSVAETGSETWSSPGLEIWLVAALPPADGGCRRSWGRILRHARSGGGFERPEVARAELADRPAGQLEADYEALLGRLAAAGDIMLAARELAALETPMVEDDVTAMRPLFTAELKAAQKLAERDARCLLPLVALHAETYRVHHSEGRFPLATHSRRLAVAIAELAAELLKTSDEKALVAVAFTGLADMVETGRSSIEAQRLLERALSLDQTLEAARLLLAVSYERKGRYEDAQRQLEELVAANSAHYEARVRLAILLRRVGDTAEAEPLLRGVLAERPPAWLLSLGYQTLAQVLIRDGRLAEAVTVLEDGRKRLPGDQVLQVLLAYALDRSGERRAIQSILADLPLGDAAVTPRYRYSDEPAAALGLLRETLRQSVTVRLPVLALALSAEQSKGGRG